MSWAAPAGNANPARARRSRRILHRDAATAAALPAPLPAFRWLPALARSLRAMAESPRHRGPQHPKGRLPAGRGHAAGPGPTSAWLSGGHSLLRNTRSRSPNRSRPHLRRLWNRAARRLLRKLPVAPPSSQPAFRPGGLHRQPVRRPALTQP